MFSRLFSWFKGEAPQPKENTESTNYTCTAKKYVDSDTYCQFPSKNNISIQTEPIETGKPAPVRKSSLTKLAPKFQFGYQENNCTKHQAKVNMGTNPPRHLSLSQPFKFTRPNIHSPNVVESSKSTTLLSNNDQEVQELMFELRTPNTDDTQLFNFFPETDDLFTQNSFRMTPLEQVSESNSQISESEAQTVSNTLSSQSDLEDTYTD